MPIADLPLERFRNQQLGGNVSMEADKIVAWLGEPYRPRSMRVQNGQSVSGCQAALRGDREKAVADGRIVLTWAFRGKLHFVAAPDIRWMLALLAPGIITKACFTVSPAWT